MKNKFEGGCHCGAIRYNIKGKHFAAEYCHCKTCQTITGSPVSAWMDFKIEQVTWLNKQPKEYLSSKFVRRGFCNDCGSTLTYRNIEHSNYITLAITTLDDPNIAHPTYHIYTENQTNWIQINDDYPRFKKGKT